MASKPNTPHPTQWSRLKKDHPRQLWALERMPQSSPLSRKITHALSRGACSQGDLDILWEIAHELELCGRLDVSTPAPQAGTPVQDSLRVVSKTWTYNIHGDRIYRVLLQHPDGWWARLELRPEGTHCQDLQQNTSPQVHLKCVVQEVQSGVAVLGGLLRRMEYE